VSLVATLHAARLLAFVWDYSRDAAQTKNPACIELEKMQSHPRDPGECRIAEWRKLEPYGVAIPVDTVLAECLFLNLRVSSAIL
jgi:hypothetical protein